MHFFNFLPIWTNLGIGDSQTSTNPMFLSQFAGLSTLVFENRWTYTVYYTFKIKGRIVDNNFPELLKNKVDYYGKLILWTTDTCSTQEETCCQKGQGQATRRLTRDRIDSAGTPWKEWWLGLCLRSRSLPWSVAGGVPKQFLHEIHEGWAPLTYGFWGPLLEFFTPW
jgi:hypothetical protein